MPLLFIFLLIMVAYAVVMGDMPKAANFLLYPDFSNITLGTVMIAMGQAFFSIGLGMAAMITFGCYLNKDISIPNSAGIIILADTVVALVAGLAIFPLVFAFDLAPSGGPGLIFQTLPVAFGKLWGGNIFGSLFFFLLIAAAMTSCISGIEAIVAWMEERRNVDRKKGALIVGFFVWLTGGLTIFSFGEGANFHPLNFISVLEGKTIFDLLDFLVANILLLIVSILTSVFLGWVAPKYIHLESIGLQDGICYRIWLFVIRYIVPIFLITLLIAGIIK